MDTLQKRAKIKEMVESYKGQFFSVNFIKKTTGEDRKMNCRTGVTFKLKGGISGSAHCPDLMCVYDVDKGAYRNITLDNVTRITGNGTTTYFD